MAMWRSFKPNRVLKDWRSHLTPVFRVLFRNRGETLVQRDVYVYKSAKKKKAALAWLHEQRTRRRWVTWLIILLAAYPVIAGYSEYQKYKISRQNEAWLLIAQGPSTQANIGLKGALETLHRDGVPLKRLRLPRAWLEGVQLPKADLRWSILQRAQINGADLSGANLSEVFFGGADLHNANLMGANLQGTKLTGATLRNVNLTGANITGADFSQARELTQKQVSSACANPDKLPRLPPDIQPPPPCPK